MPDVNGGLFFAPECLHNIKEERSNPVRFSRQTTRFTPINRGSKVVYGSFRFFLVPSAANATGNPWVIDISVALLNEDDHFCILVNRNEWGQDYRNHHGETKRVSSNKLKKAKGRRMSLQDILLVPLALGRIFPQNNSSTWWLMEQIMTYPTGHY